MLNSHDRAEAMLRQHLEVEATEKHADIERAKAAAREQRERFEALKRQAQLQMQRQAAMANPSIISWQGAATSLFLLALAAGMFLVATYLGN